MLITPFAAQESAMYVIIAPVTALEQHVAGDRPLHQPTIAITKKADTAKVIATDLVNVFTFRFLLLLIYFRFILQRAGSVVRLERRFQLRILSVPARPRLRVLFHRRL